MKKELKNKFRVCPLCLGSGKIKSLTGSYQYYNAEIRQKARELYRKGFSYREIGKKIGVNHPQKVASMIKSVRF